MNGSEGVPNTVTSADGVSSGASNDIAPKSAENNLNGGERHAADDGSPSKSAEAEKIKESTGADGGEANIDGGRAMRSALDGAAARLRCGVSQVRELLVWLLPVLAGCLVLAGLVALLESLFEEKLAAINDQELVPRAGSLLRLQVVALIPYMLAEMGKPGWQTRSLTFTLVSAGAASTECACVSHLAALLLALALFRTLHILALALCACPRVSRAFTAPQLLLTVSMVTVVLHAEARYWNLFDFPATFFTPDEESSAAPVDDGGPGGWW